jgi:serine protease Do
VNGELATGVDALKSQIGKNQKRLALLVLRGDERMFVPVAVG